MGINCRLTNALCIVNPRDTETVISCCTGGQDCGVVNRCAHDANSKRGILRVCRVYLAKRSTDKAVFQCVAQFEGI